MDTGFILSIPCTFRKKCCINLCPVNCYNATSILTFQDTVRYQFLWITFTLTLTSGKIYSLVFFTRFGPLTSCLFTTSCGGTLKGHGQQAKIAGMIRTPAAKHEVRWLHKGKLRKLSKVANALWDAQNSASNYEVWSVQHKLKLTLMVLYNQTCFSSVL